MSGVSKKDPKSLVGREDTEILMKPHRDQLSDKHMGGCSLNPQASSI